jgi:hypothetical protein
VIGLRSAETRLRLIHLARYHPGASSLGRDSQRREGAHCDEHKSHIGWNSLARKILSSVHGLNGLPSSYKRGVRSFTQALGGTGRMKWDIPEFHSLVQCLQCLRCITSRCMNPSNLAWRLPRQLKGGIVCICCKIHRWEEADESGPLEITERLSRHRQTQAQFIKAPASRPGELT